MKGKIRLLVDGHWFDHQHESTAVFLKGLYSQLLRDNDFEIFIAAYDIEKLKKEFDNSSKITYLKLTSSSKYYRLLFDFPRIIRKNKIDIAHFQYIVPFLKTTKEIVTIHDILYKDFPAYFPFGYKLRNNVFFRQSAKRADLITSVSNYSIKAIHKYFRIPIDRIHLVPNGVSKDFFTTPDFSNVRETFSLKDFILCVSRIEPRKNHLFLVQAYCELELWKSDIQLVLVGRQDIKVKELDTYLDSLSDSVRKNIIRLENVSLVDLKNLYQQAKVVVYPSLGEGFGIPPLEAAALKARVLCSNATAMSDFSFFRESLFDPHDLEAFKTKLIDNLIFVDYNESTRISGEIKTRYNWETIAGLFANEVKKAFKT
ncbi:MAG: glycosyltransferase family 4 protein [Bacteroidia bacterium]